MTVVLVATEEELGLEKHDDRTPSSHLNPDVRIKSEEGEFLEGFPALQKAKEVKKQKKQ